MARKTTVSIEGGKFLINGQPTYAGRTYEGASLEGLLMNARLVQGIFDDENPQTRKLWAYPDGKAYDAERNTAEFVAAMPEWRRHGLLAFTLNLQGGSPQGYSKDQPWINSAFTWDGALKPAYLGRLEKILDKADELGMVVILGYFYFGQEPRMNGEAALVKATDAATDSLLEKGYRNVLVEVANECDVERYKHEIVKPSRAHELIEHVQKRSEGKVASPAKRLLVSTSNRGGQVPGANIVTAADFVLLHGNGVGEPAKIAGMVEATRKVKGYRGQPVLFNEDDHFDFDQPANNMLAAVKAGASWGYFDYRMKTAGGTGLEGFIEGYQSPPVAWGIVSERKKGFFGLLQKMTGK